MDAEPDRSNGIRRRTLLRGAGIAAVLVAGGGVWRAERRGVLAEDHGVAFEPWESWQAGSAQIPTMMVAAAILASNAHNTQPWLFRLDGSRVDLFADEERDIGAVDPYSREMQVGLGCALENLLLAARAAGYGHRLVLAPDPAQPAHVARVELVPARPEESPLYAAIPLRHTNRYPYATNRPIAGGVLDGLGALSDDQAVPVFWFTSTAERTRFADLLASAAEAINADEEQSYANGPRWLRESPQDVEHHRDGLTLDTMGLAGPELLAAKMLPTPSTEAMGEAWLTTLRGQAATAGAFGVLAVRDDRDCAQRMQAGRLWQRMHLWTVTEGLAAQPMNQLHERADREVQLDQDPEFGDALQDLVADPGWRAVFSFRVGYPTREAPPSPRRAVEAVVV